MKTKGFFRSMTAVIVLIMVLVASACKQSGPAQTTEPPERPQVTAAPEKVAPPDAKRYEGYSLRLKPVHGPEVILQEPIGAELVLDAYASDRLQVKDAICKFGNRLDVLDPTGAVKDKFTLASDGQMLIKAANGRVFYAPEYIYYLLEESLWTFRGSLIESPMKWQPSADTTLLELDLPRLIKTSMLPAFGYANAYFTSYKIYGTNTSERDVAKVYLLLTYAGYDTRGTAFSPNFLYTTPATIIFKKIDNVWQLTGFRQPPEPKEKKDRFSYTNVRNIFPYEQMEAVMEDIKKDDGQVGDIVRQATEYLNKLGISGLIVDK